MKTFVGIFTMSFAGVLAVALPARSEATVRTVPAASCTHSQITWTCGLPAGSDMMATTFNKAWFDFGLAVNTNIIVYLKKQTVLTTYVDQASFPGLTPGVWYDLGLPLVNTKQAPAVWDYVWGEVKGGVNGGAKPALYGIAVQY